MKDAVQKYALQNAVRHNGKPDEGAVLGAVLAHNSKLKSKIKELKAEIKKTVKEISKLSVDEQQEILKKIAPELLEEKPVKKKELPEWKTARKVKFITRFEPSPSGPLHIGHAYVLGLVHAYTQMYDGKLIFRISDTNPENIDPNSYNLLEEDAKWLTNNKISEFMVQSNHMQIYYKYAEKLIELEKAYVCTCPAETYKTAYSDKMKACPCRDIPKKENIERWKRMFREYKPGEAVLRIKTDIKHKNPALRDWAAFRINDFSHPRQGDAHRVWPLMNFSVVVDDIESKMTHIIRGKDHYDNAKKQEYVYKYLKKPVPETMFGGKINFEDMMIKCSKIRLRIEAGEFTSWDDIRLPFLAALRRRGYQAEAFVKFSIDIGPSKTDKTMTGEEYFTLLNSYNKDIIESKANRYFFISNPVEVEIKDAPEQKIEIELHPDYPERGKRIFKTKNNFLMAKDDFDSLKENKLYRLMDCLNFTKIGNELIFDSLEYEKYKKQGEKIMHWLPVQKDLIEVVVLMPDATTERGFAETGVKKLKPGGICQLERFGFARLDEIKEGKYRFWFAHR